MQQLRYIMQRILIAMLFLPASYHSYLNCRIACRNCREQNYEPELLEVYCGMCNECKMRRQEQLKYRIGRTKADDHNKKQYTEIPMESLHHLEMIKQSDEQIPKGYDEGLQNDDVPGRPKNDRPDIKQNVQSTIQDSASQENNGDQKEVAVEYAPECPMPPPCSDDEEEVRPDHLMFSPGPFPPPYPPPYCPVYTPCVYPYPSNPPSTTSTPYIEPTTTTSTTIATTTSITTTQRSTSKRHALKQSSRKPKPKRILKPAAVPPPYIPPPCFMPYNPCPNFLPPMPLAPMSIPPLPAYIPASHHPLNVPETTTEPKVPKDHYYVYVGVPKDYRLETIKH